MLPEEIARSVSSIEESELEELYKEFCATNGKNKDDKFISGLYKSDRINIEELKSYQFLKRIELTALANPEEVQDESQDTSSEDNDLQDGFTIMESIDEGGMGEILIAQDNELGRAVAYKRIHPHVAEVPSYLGRFIMEAQVTAQLQHPNIVPVYAMKVEEGKAAYAMKLIQGKTLKDLIEESRQQLDQKGKLDKHHNLQARLEHFLKVCDAIHYAHRKGVIHRDLKPLNIMVGPYNEVYVMDWGIAKIISVDDAVFEDPTKRIDAKTEDDTGETKVGQLLGTPAYMSPEQASGQNDIIDHRSDLFSLGLILFELITLFRAYVADEELNVLGKACLAKLEKPVLYPRHPPVPKQLIAIVNKATQLNPDDRYDTVEKFADDIRRYMRGVAIKAKRDTSIQKLMRWMNRHRLAVLNIVIYTIILSVVAVGWSFYQQQQGKMQAQVKEQKLSSFLTSVASKSQMIDAEFLKYEGILEGLAHSATNLLGMGKQDESPYYTDLDIASSEHVPPDYSSSNVYGFPISVGWHVNKLAPEVDFNKVEPLIKKLNPLRHSFQRLMLKSYHETITPEETEKVKKIIHEEGLPLIWSYIGLEEGLFAEYPGKTGYPPEFDPRKRPWYQGTLGNKGAQWLKPYIDVGGQGVLLPCTSPLFNDQGTFLGVAGVEIKLDYIRNNLIPMTEFPGIEDTYLLNEKGQIVVASSDRAESYKLGTLINSIRDLTVYSNPEVVDAIMQGKSGYVSNKSGGKEKLIVYYRLNSIGWYYLAEASTSQIIETVQNN
ncbi:MAG: serine/threonine protein kinase [Proteobacteria bacterium]|nr:serine/threonine protein kinase [Pseudomonadota bacterium]